MALWLIFIVAAPLHAWLAVPRVDAAPPPPRPAAGSGSNYLLVGSDGRDDLTPEQRRRLGTGMAQGQRTDSIMIVHVPARGGQRAIISIPRDSYLPIPGHGSNRINAAFAFGGPRLLIQSLEQATGLRIDGYAEIGFAGFADVVDSLGGVRICVPFDMNDPKAHINLRKGCQVLDGPNALGFVRARYSDPRGDIGRAERQRQFLGAIMAEAASPSTVLIPWRWWRFTHAASNGVALGQDTSMWGVLQVLLAMRGMGNDSTLSLKVPIASLNHQTSVGSTVLWDSEQAQRLFDMLRRGDPLTKDTAPTGS